MIPSHALNCRSSRIPRRLHFIEDRVRVVDVHLAVVLDRLLSHRKISIPCGKLISWPGLSPLVRILPLRLLLVKLCEAHLAKGLVGHLDDLQWPLRHRIEQVNITRLLKVVRGSFG